MLVTALERERRQIYQSGLLEGERKGLLEGKQEGLLEGIIEGKIEDAKVMLTKGMDIALISEITNLPEKQLLQLKTELSSE